MAGLTKATGPIGLRMILFLAELERVRRTYHPSPEERSMTTYHPDPNDPDDDEQAEEDLPPKPPIEDQLPEEGIDPRTMTMRMTCPLRRSCPRTTRTPMTPWITGRTTTYECARHPA